MWRLSRKLTNDVNSKVVQRSLRIRQSNHWQFRLYATPVHSSSSGGVGKIFLGLFGASILAGGGTVAYAKYDRGFRSWLEKTVPYSDWAITLVIGPYDEQPSPKPSSGPAVTSPLVSQQPTKEKAVQSSLLQKKLDREAAKKEVESSVEQPASAPVTSSSSSPKHAATDLAVKKDQKSDVAPSPASDRTSSKSGAQVSSSVAKVQQRLASRDATVAIENEALERHIQESIQSLQEVVTEALRSYEAATLAFKQHSESVQKAVEKPEMGDESASWDSVSSTSAAKVAALSKAEACSVKARDALQKVQSVIQEGRKSKLTSNNEVLIIAEEAVSSAIYGLQKAESEVALVQSESNVLGEYKKLVEQGREQFKKELQVLVPDVQVGEKGKKLTEDEHNLIIAHAYRRVGQLEQQLSSHQSGEQERVLGALEAQRREHDKLVNNRLNIELQRQQRELEIDYKQKFVDLNEEFEQELLQQLRRQAAAHSEHLRDVLQAQQKQLAVDYERRFEDHVTEARHEFQRELSGSLGRLKGIETGLEARSGLDTAARQAQRLWVACQALRHSIRKGKANPSSWEEQRKPLSSEIHAVSKAAGVSDKYVEVVLSAVPPVALNQGVFTEDALKDRFFNVDTACRRVALVGEQGGSLLRYALSYVQSLLVVSSPLLTGAEAADEPIDVDALKTFDILDRARWYVDRDNLEQALRYMNLLEGAPKFVASDWVTELKRLLEVQQVADALVARAAATEVQAAQ